MKALTAAGDKRETAREKQASREANIVETMRRHFQNDSGKAAGDLEYSILNSVKRYFEGQPGKRLK